MPGGSGSADGDWRDEPAWSVPSLREPRYSQSLERGLAILRCFTPARTVLGIADIADELQMSRSTTHRYVVTLVALGYLEQGPGRKYRLGLRVTDLGLSALSATRLRDHAHQYLEDLAQRTSFTSTLAVLDGDEVLCVDGARTLRRDRDAASDRQPGARAPVYCTAPGKLLLAHLPDREQRELVASLKLGRRAPNTITSRRALHEELTAIRAAPLAVSDRELAPQLCEIAAPVRDQGRTVTAAVNLVAPATAISAQDLATALGPHLIATADRISARLGFRREDEQR
jgi:IclR family pca regulon transcriptional regulator